MKILFSHLKLKREEKNTCKLNMTSIYSISLKRGDVGFGVLYSSRLLAVYSPIGVPGKKCLGAAFSKASNKLNICDNAEESAISLCDNKIETGSRHSYLTFNPNAVIVSGVKGLPRICSKLKFVAPQGLSTIVSISLILVL